MTRRSKIPKREWIAVVLPAACAVTLLAAAFTDAAGRADGWLVVLSCFAGGAAFPLTYTLALLRDRRLYLRDAADVERNRDRIAASRPIGWILGVCFLAAGVGLGGVSKVVLLATLGGLAFGFWPGLVANFVRLRREHHWG